MSSSSSFWTDFMWFLHFCWNSRHHCTRRLTAPCLLIAPALTARRHAACLAFAKDQQNAERDVSLESAEASTKTSHLQSGEALDSH
ncbi:uncharacterized protein V6R79_008151 [Siganus canaliculatus]